MKCRIEHLTSMRSCQVNAGLRLTCKTGDAIGTALVHGFVLVESQPRDFRIGEKREWVKWPRVFRDSENKDIKLFDSVITRDSRLLSFR